MNELKTPGLNNPETYVLTHNRFNTYMILIFTDLKKAQIYRMPYRNSPHQEIEKVMSFGYLRVFGLDERIKMKISYSKLKIENMFMWEKNYLVLKQMMKLWIIFQNMVIMMLNIHMLMGKKIFTSC